PLAPRSTSATRPGPRVGGPTRPDGWAPDPAARGEDYWTPPRRRRITASPPAVLLLSPSSRFPARSTRPDGAVPLIVIWPPRSNRREPAMLKVTVRGVESTAPVTLIG